MEDKSTVQLTSKDFASDQMVRWCPGCGDYAILKAMQNAMPIVGKKREDFVFIAGIGCSSRFPYYMNTYGFHTIHGRGPAIATGLKMANPELSVWQITGDGDGLSIGGNHFVHLMRRNIDLNIILFNNEIYGLTKGQYSPTSAQGLTTKSSPQGSIEVPFNPGELALGAKSNFFARVPDTSPKLMTEVFVKAEEHNGTSLVEILQNCVIFNDKVFGDVTGREVRDDAQIWLEHGERMLFGKEKDKGLRLNGLKLEVVKLGENGVTEDDILIHDAKETDPTLHMMLVRMERPNFPVAMGVIRQVETSTYNDRIMEQIKDTAATSNFKNVNDLLNSGDTWKIN